MEMSETPGSSRPRPPSSRPGSREAWKDPQQIYDNDPENAVDAPAPYGDGGDQPVAMESEVFDKDGSVRVQQRQTYREEPEGCWYKFRAGLRAIWMTKHTEETKHDRELYIRTTLRELIIYIIFLIVLCIVTFAMTTSTMFYYTKVMSELFLDTSFPDSTKTYRGISRMDDFWTFAYGPMMDGLYWETWYDLKNVSLEERGMIFYENKLLGVPRMRMLKVKSDSCKVPDAFAREIKQCFDGYTGADEDKSPFGPQNGTAWTYRSESDLEGGSHWGIISTYGGGGFVQDLGMTRAEALRVLDVLKGNRWIDRGTRVILIDFTVYNANINLFCVIRMVLEFPATGGIIPSSSFRTIKLIRYVTAFDYFVLACEGIFCAFILYYIIEEIIEIKKHRCSYFKSFWNLLDVIVIFLALCCISFSIYRQVSVDRKLTDLLENDGKYANFEFLSFAQTRFNDFVAVMVFFAWIKIFKYISFNKTMNQLSSTLSRCAKDVGGFAVMFFIFFFAYAQLGYLIFGTQVKDFSTFYDAVFTLLRTILGDFDFHELEQANRVLGPIFFITYVFFVFFVLLNMFLAIINDTYAEVKAELATQKNEFEIADYFKRGYYNMLRKMNLKKDKIIDIQAALNGSDMNSDKQVDYDEWRQHLKQRGYADQEIESMFAKYDLDGDRVLNENEQSQMRDDLDGQRRSLEEAMDKDRPPTAGSRFDDFEPSGDTSDLRPTRRRGHGTVSADEFNVLNRRVDRMEQSVAVVVNKIDAVLQKLEGMEKVKMRHREKIAALMSEISQSSSTESEKLKIMSEGMNEELERFERDSETGEASDGATSPRV